MKKFIVDRFEGNKAVLECENGETAVFERKALPKNIKEIGGSCFSSCSALTEIRFEGTKDEWRAIVKGKDWNYDCGNYVIKCTDGDIAKADDK